MMSFGTRNTFSIEYQLMEDPYDNEVGLQKDSWGTMFLWVKNKNIFQFRDNVPCETYQWNLCHLVGWFSERINIIMKEISFPLPVTGNNSIDLMNKCEGFDFENDDEYYKWHQKWYSWNERHGFSAETDGSLLPNAYFRRVSDNIEISWDNNELYENVNFMHLSGVELVSAQVFHEVVMEFLNDFFKTFQFKYPKEINEYKKLLQH